MKIVISTFDDFNHLIETKVVKTDSQLEINDAKAEEIRDFIDESSFRICPDCEGEGLIDVYTDRTRQSFIHTRSCICQYQDEPVREYVK